MSRCAFRVVSIDDPAVSAGFAEVLPDRDWESLVGSPDGDGDSPVFATLGTDTLHLVSSVVEMDQAWAYLAFDLKPDTVCAALDGAS